jgi:hypothetical protein
MMATSKTKAGDGLNEKERKKAEKAELITREAAALRLSLSTHELRRRERLGQITIHSRNGPHGSALYRLEDIDELERLIQLQKEGSYTVQEAQAVFKLLGEGKTPIQCVVEGGVKPEVANKLASVYAEMANAIYITPATIKRINDLVIDGPLPIKTEKDIVDFFLFVEGARCLECQRRPRAFCTTCVKEALKKKAAAAAEGDEDPDL